MEEVGCVLDVRGGLLHQRTEVVIHKLGNLLSGRVTRRHDWPARVSWFVDLWEKVEPGRLGCEGGQVSPSVLVDGVTLPHLL